MLVEHGICVLWKKWFRRESVCKGDTNHARRVSQITSLFSAHLRGKKTTRLRVEKNDFS
jgi:hypothetical protein